MASCCPPRLCKKQQGAYPYLIAPLLNYDVVIPYFNVTVGTVVRRAWLFPPPIADGQPVQIKLESSKMALGCDGVPQRATVVTSIVGTGNTMPNGTPTTLRVRNTETGNTYTVACETDLSGYKRLLYRLVTPATTCGTAAVGADWMRLTQVTPTGNLRLGNITQVADGGGVALSSLLTASPDILDLSYAPPVVGGYPTALTLVWPEACLDTERGGVTRPPPFLRGTVVA